MNIVRHFMQAANSYPNNVAIVQNGKSIHYSELKTRILQTTNSLSEKGYKKGDNIMVMIPFSVELYVHILAIFSLGANVVLIDQLKPKSRVYYAFKKSECKAIITTKTIALLKFFLFSKKLWNTIITIPISTKTNDGYIDRKDTDSALITFTSGTTGNPKAADRTHGFLNTQLQTLIDEMRISPRDIHITSLPVVLMCNLAVGATSIIPPKYKNTNAWKLLANQFPPNILSASPHHFSEISRRIQNDKLDRVFVGGATILPSFVKQVAKNISHNKVTFVYGSTEAEPMTTLSLETYSKLISTNSVGLPVGRNHPNIQLKINTKDSTTLKEQPEGQIGEIIVAGPHVLHTYFKDEEAFARNKIIANDIIWHRTGDAGYIKDEQLYYFSRMRYAWILHDEWLAPLTLEKYLSINGYLEEGTWLNVKGKNILFIQKTKNLKKVIESFPYTIDETVFIKQLPRDKRHLSRVDYEQLLCKYES
ncbi:MAG: hypothetical protein COA58_09595 [Bacteroidetes bacterium]|nr:MAG: hypothetical protein COA58_09595 [Bacteroidota bacterium]